MNHRTTARIVGGLFITAAVTGVMSVAFQQTDFTKASLNTNGVATAAVLELIEAMAVVWIAIAIYPVFRRFRERLATGYVAVRTMEGMLIVFGTIVELTLLTVSQKYLSAGAHDASLQTLGAVLLAVHDWVYNAVLAIVFPLGALILNYVLYQARLVPRWLSVWGLGGAALWLAVGVAVTYGIQAMPVLAVPMALQEMALALWLIFKGFSAAAFGSEHEEEPAASRSEPERGARSQLSLRPGS